MITNNKTVEAGDSGSSASTLLIVYDALLAKVFTQILGMTLDGLFEDFGVHLRCADFLVTKHPGKVLNGHVLGKDQGGEGVTSQVGGQRLIELQFCLYQMKIVIILLIRHSRQSEVVHTKDFHSRRKDRGEEVSPCLDTATIYIIKVTYLFCHRSKVESLSITVGKTSEAGEDEQVTGFLFLAAKLNAAQLIDFIL